MNKILNWFKFWETKEQPYVKPQKFVDLKRTNSIVSFIHPGHPLYDNIAAKEENRLRILAPNETAYSENSLTHNFAAIVIYNGLNYLIINSLKHFKEQSIGGLLQFDENIYNVIPFFEDEEEYQTASDYTFRETYEYDHPVESYAFLAEQNGKSVKITLDHGKKPVNVKMIDEKRSLFSAKLTAEQVELIDYVVMPALNAYTEILNKRKSRAS